MPIFLIANPKGGAGKSTVATNLAGYFARRGHATMLGDLSLRLHALTGGSLNQPAARAPSEANVYAIRTGPRCGRLPIFRATRKRPGTPA